MVVPWPFDVALSTPGYRYGFSVAVSLVAVALTAVLFSMTGHGMFVLPVVAVVLASWYGGHGPGLLSAFLCGLSVTYVFIEPRYSVAGIAQWEEGLQLLVFAIVSVMISRLSERRYQAEHGLRARTAELEAANRELESFSYSVSHDLRWPLRAIDGYSRILLDDYAEHLVPQARRYLIDIRRSTQHMDQLVEDLLLFSQLGRQPLHRQPVNIRKTVEEVLEELRADSAFSHADITMTDLPDCHADPRLLKHVLMNLVDNAFKFSRSRQPPRIHIGHRFESATVVYFVKDNGVGFEMKYADQVFGVFQRLHGVEEYEGTGVGLAMVQRIIHRHGGSIWADGAPDHGATFFFTIGKDGS